MDVEDIRRIVAESASLNERFFTANAAALVRLGRSMSDRLLAGGLVLAFGNGGSAADAQHFASELVGRLARERRAVAALALSSDPSIVSALANDLGFESVFRRQVEAYGRPGDYAVAISTSGRSPNVIAAARLARERGLRTVALTGNGGGPLASLVDHLIDVPHADTQRIQEVHGMVLHVLAQIVEEAAAG